MRDALKKLACRLFGCRTVVMHRHTAEFEGTVFKYAVVRCSRCGAVELETS